ncbi:uncharacterized protein LOC127841842 [Dreissena polymorpha]|uniref:uncharacterized protein LOC127841842 n=1 Tax=Dreissena polymorpha TaxID=45954 RepID=UPI0022649B92|nr:uncharacterized protein LOC127841842 [Dreissena polymorpha]XP_052226929.1 uncharacterized protein LOC127841842 [Dreissena polymorpha]
MGRQSMAFQLNPDKVITLKENSEHDTRISSDFSQTCKITGICSLPSGQIVIADQLTKRVKLLDQQYNVVSHCTVSGSLWDICHITCNEVAVTVRDDQTSSVQFISVSNWKLVNKRKFPLQHDVLGISHHQGVLYVSSRTALYHYRLNGTLVKKIYEDVSGADTVWKCVLSSIADRIYIINSDHHRLLTLSPNRTLLFTFIDPQLQYPWCDHVTTAGGVLVCGLTSQTIIQVDREGRRKLDTLATETDVESYPISVCYNINKNITIVGMFNISEILV